jgi:hypothetical protein
MLPPGGVSIDASRFQGSCKKIDLFLFQVIPAKAEIQYSQDITNLLDPGFHRGDG